MRIRFHCNCTRLQRWHYQSLQCRPHMPSPRFGTDIKSTSEYSTLLRLAETPSGFALWICLYVSSVTSVSPTLNETRLLRRHHCQFHVLRKHRAMHRSLLVVLTFRRYFADNVRQTRYSETGSTAWENHRRIRIIAPLYNYWALTYRAKR